MKNKHFSTNFKKNLNNMLQIILYSESRVAYNRDAGICILFDWIYKYVIIKCIYLSLLCKFL